MRRTTIAIALVVVSTLVLSIPASAVTYGERDTGDEHPYVAAALFYVEIEGDLVPAWFCSGTFIDANTLLTAAHCTFGADGVDVLIGNDLGDGFTEPDQVVAGKPVSHSDYDDFAEFPQTYDIGVVELDTPVVLDSYPEVAPLGYVDELIQQPGRGNLDFTVVGYGIQHSQVTGAVVEDGEPEMTFDDTIDGWRHVGSVSLVALNSAYTDGINLHHSGNSGSRSGGTCFGDSGGPLLHGDTIVGITSFGIGNPMCRGNTGFAYRTDIDASQDFLSPYLN